MFLRHAFYSRSEHAQVIDVGSIGEQSASKGARLVTVDLVCVIEDVVQLVMRGEHVLVEARRDRNPVFLQDGHGCPDKLDLFHCQSHGCRIKV